MGLAGATGVIRDGQDRWILGFVVNLGKASCVLVEIWGLYFGLKRIQSLELSKTVIKLDFTVVVGWIVQGIFSQQASLLWPN